MPSYVTCPQIFISTLYSSYNWSLFIEIVFMLTTNITYSILFVRSFHHHLFTLSKRTHYIIRSISQAIISVLSELVTPKVLQPGLPGLVRPRVRSCSSGPGGPTASSRFCSCPCWFHTVSERGGRHPAGWSHGVLGESSAQFLARRATVTPRAPHSSLEASLLNPKPRLTSCKASDDGVHGGTPGRQPHPEGVVVESLARCLSLVRSLTYVAHPFRRLLVESLAEPVCTFVLLTMVCPAAFDLVVVVWLS